MHVAVHHHVLFAHKSFQRNLKFIVDYLCCWSLIFPSQATSKTCILLHDILCKIACCVSGAEFGNMIKNWFEFDWFQLRIPVYNIAEKVIVITVAMQTHMVHHGRTYPQKQWLLFFLLFPLPTDYTKTLCMRYWCSCYNNFLKAAFWIFKGAVHGDKGQTVRTAEIGETVRKINLRYDS